jgi:hypothetical protein
MPHPKVITAETVRQAGHLIDQALEATEASVSSPGLDQLAAARRELDPVVRSQKTTAALKEGARDMHAARDRLNKLKQQQASPSSDVEFTPEAQRELAALKEHILTRIRRRAEEEIARNYPEQSSGKRRRPPRRRLTV